MTSGREQRRNNWSYADARQTKIVGGVWWEWIGWQNYFGSILYVFLRTFSVLPHLRRQNSVCEPLLHTAGGCVVDSG
jgi:hypothetical protein